MNTLICFVSLTIGRPPGGGGSQLLNGSWKLCSFPVSSNNSVLYTHARYSSGFHGTVNHVIK